MSKHLLVGNEIYEFPEEGDNAGYGESITDWAVAVTNALSSVQKPNDIIDTTATILNNVTTSTPIAAFSFDTSQVISILSDFRIQRTTESPVVNLVESGTIEGNYNGSDWNITIRSIGNAGVTLAITAAGQITYTSTELNGSNYSGQISFRAKVFNNEF